MENPFQKIPFESIFYPMQGKKKTFLLLALGLLFLWSSSYSPEASGGAPKLYISECQDDLKKTLVEAIREAHASIYLVIYSLTDSQVIRALKERADLGVKVTVVHDTTTFQKALSRLGKRVKRIPKEKNGLMHKKILVVDGEKVWIGSANFTAESLKVDDNLVIGLQSPKLAEAITTQTGEHSFKIGPQKVEYWSLPEDKEEGLARLIGLIDCAQNSLRIAMFTWTHPALTKAVIEAHRRGVVVEAALDRGQAIGVCWRTYQELLSAGVPVRLSDGVKLLHHKSAWIDETILINGSANWTKAAFSKNDDCFLILFDLTKRQTNKLEKMWQVLRCTCSADKEHFTIFGQRPEVVADDLLEPITLAA